MSEFIDPSEFDNEDELFAYILEHLVKPKLQETLGDEGDVDQVSGMVYVFGGRGGIDQEIVERIQSHLQDGLDLDYVLREMCNLQVRTTRETTFGELNVRYVELMREEDDTAPLSAEELETMFLRSPDE